MVIFAFFVVGVNVVESHSLKGELGLVSHQMHHTYCVPWWYNQVRWVFRWKSNSWNAVEWDLAKFELVCWLSTISLSVVYRQSTSLAFVRHMYNTSSSSYKSGVDWSCVRAVVLVVFVMLVVWDRRAWDLFGSKVAAHQHKQHSIHLSTPTYLWYFISTGLILRIKGRLDSGVKWLDYSIWDLILCIKVHLLLLNGPNSHLLWQCVDQRQECASGMRSYHPSSL